MCSAVVPQQPPTMLSQPFLAHSPMMAAMFSGVSSYSPKALGNPAFGWQETKASDTAASSSTCGRSSFAPSAQFSPIASGRACRTEL